jgi:hypothetical protein
VGIENKVGKFRISSELVHGAAEGKDNFREAIRMIMEKVIILEADFHYYNNSFEYIAYSEEFEPVKEGVIVPEYYVVIHTEVNKETGEVVITEITFSKVAGESTVSVVGGNENA